eukprot:5527472-Karenia_brevis.AAC.1
MNASSKMRGVTDILSGFVHHSLLYPHGANDYQCMSVKALRAHARRLPMQTHVLRVLACLAKLGDKYFVQSSPSLSTMERGSADVFVVQVETCYDGNQALPLCLMALP